MELVMTYFSLSFCFSYITVIARYCRVIW